MNDETKIFARSAIAKRGQRRAELLGRSASRRHGGMHQTSRMLDRRNRFAFRATSIWGACQEECLC